MKGRCHYCKMLTASAENPGATLPDIDPGYRLGYVMETADKAWLICADCVATRMHDRGEKAAA